MTTVPNLLPTIYTSPHRIAIIGEAPGEEEEKLGQPFVGPSGGFLNVMLSSVGILRDSCFLGNVCQTRPPYNDITKFSWTGPEIQVGLAKLTAQLKDYQPNLVLLLGNTPLKAAGATEKVTNFRGTLFMGSFAPLVEYKCLATYHPAYVLRDYSVKPITHFDYKRAEAEGRTPALTLPQRELNVDCVFEIVKSRLLEVIQTRPPISIDIEGGITNGMTCCSIATSRSSAFIVPFFHGQWCPWSLDEEIEIWSLFAKVLEDVTIPKTLQNCLYDTFVLAFGYRIHVANVAEDTMLKGWELFCELEKSLAMQASIYTREPFYKSDRKTDLRDQYFRYCCKDSAVTKEIAEVQDAYLEGASKAHYHFNMKLLYPLRYMELRGILFDKDAAKIRADETLTKAYELQFQINKPVYYIGVNKAEYTTNDYFLVAKERLCQKRLQHVVEGPADLISASKTSCYEASIKVYELLIKGNLTPRDHGELSTLLSIQGFPSLHINVDSPDQIADYLYSELKLPTQYKKEKGRLTDKVTTDVLALLNLYQKTENELLKSILHLRSLYTQLETLSTSTDLDNRIRCGYNLVGTETGRLACYESPSGSGFNLQTVSKKFRNLFRADPGYEFFQCDLSGADGWTVAAWCKSLGDPTMWDDYMFGLKPAKLGVLMHKLGRQVSSLPREELKRLSDQVDQDEWEYFAFKRVQHGTNYDMKENTMSDQIVKDSYKLTGQITYVSPSICRVLQGHYLFRYHGVRLWQQRVREQLEKKGYIISASGHKRIFFGRRTDHQTYKDALADEPQNNTTYALNRAILNLWEDRDNRDGPRLIIEPLHQVHDALCGQWPVGQREWAITKVRSYFQNPLLIAGIQVTIPFEGGYGSSWGELKNKL